MDNTFDSTTEYIFVNKCLTLLHGNLPSYCYYDCNDELYNFWNEVTLQEFDIIYKYLCEINYIKHEPNDTQNHVTIVMNFVNEFFA